MEDLDFEGSDTVVIGTESRTWEGSPEELYELKEALDDVTFEDADLDDEDDVEEKAIDAVYHDRNLLACALVEAAATGMGGWTPAPDADGDEWAIVWMETPVGQMSWHVPRDLAEDLTHRCDEYDYDGHTRDEKNDRLATWAGRGCPY